MSIIIGGVIVGIFISAILYSCLVAASDADDKMGYDDI